MTSRTSHADHVSVCRSPRTGNAAEGEKVAAAEEREVTAANVAAVVLGDEMGVGADAPVLVVEALVLGVQERAMGEVEASAV
jgi:hypothetical protein